MKKYYDNALLNYSYINKIQRSNSYIESYNKHIKNELYPYLNKKGTTIINWSLFPSFIIIEEYNFKMKIINLENSDILQNNFINIKDIYIIIKCEGKSIFNFA